MQKTDEKLRVIFNLVILVLSILAILFFTIAWKILDFSVIVSYILSTFVSLLTFHQLKIQLLKGHPSNLDEPIEMQSPQDVRNRQTLVLFVLVALILATPLIILFLIPNLWLIILDGMVSGATLSELVIYLQRNKITNKGWHV